MQCDRKCSSQCDRCHDLDHCTPGTQQWGDLLLCDLCRQQYPIRQPWRIDPETGDYIDNKIGEHEWTR